MGDEPRFMFQYDMHISSLHICTFYHEHHASALARSFRGVASLAGIPIVLGVVIVVVIAAVVVVVVVCHDLEWLPGAA